MTHLLCTRNDQHQSYIVVILGKFSFSILDSQKLTFMWSPCPRVMTRSSIYQQTLQCNSFTTSQWNNCFSNVTISDRQKICVGVLFIWKFFCNIWFMPYFIWKFSQSTSCDLATLGTFLKHLYRAPTDNADLTLSLFFMFLF